MNGRYFEKLGLVLLFLSITLSLFSQTFVEQTGIALTGVRNSSAAWGDYDNDGDLDILLTGTTNSSSSGAVSKIYRNNGNNTFTEQTGIILTGVCEGSANWADYDNDGDLDILLTGLSPSGSISKIYRNNGNNTFTEQATVSLPGAYWSSAAPGDYNNDGTPDILLTGWSSTGRISKVFRNDGKNSFTEQTGISLVAVEGSSVSWCDFDNDNDLDILITGLGSVFNKIYQNNGDNSFSEKVNLPEFEYSSASCTDYDGDGDLDILAAGRLGSLMQTKIFRNNNNFTFSEQTGISLAGVYMGSVAWGDYDIDGYPDILLTGQNDAGISISKIYRNNGNNTFTEKTDIVLTGVAFSSVAWGDYDNDKDLDILMTGLDAAGTCIAKVYRNSTVTVNKIPEQPKNLSFQIQNSSVLLKWSRVTNDETPSKSLTYNVRAGRKTLGSNFISPHSATDGFRRIAALGNAQLDTSLIYKNLRWDTTYFAAVQAIDNSFKGGIFSAEVQFKISPVQVANLLSSHINENSLLFKWKRGNGDRCILFAKEGTSGTFSPVNNTTYYANPVFGDSPPIGTSGWFCIYKGELDSVVITGLDPKKNYVIQALEFQGKNGSEIYNSVIAGNIGVFSSGLFTEQPGISLAGIYNGSSYWGDYDNDGDLDIIMSGQANTGGYISKIYRNNGNNTFTEQTSIVLANVGYSSVAWGDYDNDGDLDILLSGLLGPGSFTSKIYRNNGDNTFTEQTSISLMSLFRSSATWGDYDNDGFLDVFLNGNNGSSTVSKLYHNNGNGTFSEQPGTSFVGTEYSSVAWGDYNSDGYPDILLTGSGFSKVYRNNGDKTFSEQTSIVLTGIDRGCSAWGDYDNDGDLDILHTGSDVTKIYNNQNNIFTQQTGISMTRINNSTCAWGDYDNDGKLDVLITGTSFPAGSISKIYRNNGNNTFSELFSVSLTGVYWGSVNWGDYDNDGDLDILLAGQDENSLKVTRIYSNNLIMKAGSILANAKPNAPSGLTSVINPNSVKVSWRSVTGDETSPVTMSHNLRYRLKNSIPWKYAPQAADNGYRRVPATGNMQLNNFKELKNLVTGVYYWQVQGVDQGYKGGAWSVVDSFEVKNIQAFFTFDTVCIRLPTHFTDQSVAADGIVSRKWDFSDGTTSTLQNPSHLFSTGGNFNVKLVVTSTGGAKDSLIKTVIVKIKPSAGFSAPPVCQGSPVSIVNTSSANGLTIASWYWNFGDGQTSVAQQPPPHGYLGPGNYTVLLKALATNGCIDETSKPAIVSSYPIAAITTAATGLSFCKGDSVILSVGSNSNYSYQWKITGTGITGANSSSYVAKTSGNYTVDVINLMGNCKTTASAVTVNVKDSPFKPVVVKPANYVEGKCAGEEPMRLSVDQPVSSYTYQWFRNGIPLDNATSSAYEGYLDAGTYKVEANISGCKTESDPLTLSFGNDAPAKPLLYVQDGPAVWYFVCSDTSASQYKWYFKGNLIPGATGYIYVAGKNFGTYYVIISNKKGCFARSDEITIPKGTTGIDDVDPFEDLNIYPNPTSGLISIDMNNQIFDDLYISVIAQNGKVIMKTKLEKTTTRFSGQLDLRGHARGIYFISLSLDKYKLNRKIIIK